MCCLIFKFNPRSWRPKLKRLKKKKWTSWMRTIGLPGKKWKPCKYTAQIFLSIPWNPTNRKLFRKLGFIFGCNCHSVLISICRYSRSVQFINTFATRYNLKTTVNTKTKKYSWSSSRYPIQLSMSVRKFSILGVHQGRVLCRVLDQKYAISYFSLT